MKKLFVLSMLIPLAIVCSCQKEDSAAEQRLTQRKAELDAREKALDEREKAFADRERALASVPIPRNPRPRALTRDSSGTPSASFLPPGLPPDAPERKVERERRIQERLAQRQRRLEALQRMRSLGAEASPGAENTEAVSPSPGVENTEAASPSPSSTPL